MGSSQADKAASHDRIVDATARQLRDRGFADVSVTAVMDAAGLTHGGFYKHFASKGALLTEATARALDDGGARLRARLAGAADPLSTLLEEYLSPRHRDDPGAGCAVAALAIGVEGAGTQARHRYTEQVEAYARRIAGLLPADPEAHRENHDRALAAVSTLVGALLLARAVDDPALSDDLLRTARQQLAAHLEPDPQEQPGGREPA